MYMKSPKEVSEKAVLQLNPFTPSYGDTKVVLNSQSVDEILVLPFK